MSAATAAAARFPARVRLRYYAVQNVPLLLSIGLLVAMIVVYYVLFTITQPTSKERPVSPQDAPRFAVAAAHSTTAGTEPLAGRVAASKTRMNCAAAEL